MIPVEEYLVTCIKGFLMHEASVFVQELAVAMDHDAPFCNSVLAVAFCCLFCEDKASRLGQLFELPAICFFLLPLHLVLTEHSDWYCLY